MPLSKDFLGGGSEVDGSRSKTYCSHCYQNGSFTQPDISAQEMVIQVKKILKQKFYIPECIGYFFTRNIPELARWKSRCCKKEHC
jgi:hypothetical protein